MVSIFPNLCLWRRGLRTNVGGIHSKKIYRATLIILYWSTSRDIDYFYEKTVWKNNNDKNFYLQKEKSLHTILFLQAMEILALN